MPRIHWGRLLHLRLEANGVRVECKAATVRVTYPYLGMGIAFVEMSDVDRTPAQGIAGYHLAPRLRSWAPDLFRRFPTCRPMDAAIAIPDPASAVRS